MPKRIHVILFIVAGFVAVASGGYLFSVRGLDSSPFALVGLGLVCFYLSYVLNHHVQ